MEVERRKRKKSEHPHELILTEISRKLGRKLGRSMDNDSPEGGSGVIQRCFALVSRLVG